MEYHRKQAKALVRAFHAGEPEAAARVEAVLGARARERFLLSDAQHVVAREAGYRTWPELVRAMDVEETRVEPGAAYGDGERVVVRIRRRGRNYDIDDDARAVAKAGRPPGWLAVAQDVVEAFALNVNRRGVVSVGAYEHSVHRPELTSRIADCSAAVYDALLDLWG